MPPHILYRCSAFVYFLFFLNTDKKNRCDSYKKRRLCVVSNFSIVGILVGLPVAVHNPVPASQVGFQQFRVIEHFCVESSNKRSDRGHSSNDLEFFTDRTFRASFSDFRKLINAFHFFLATMGERASQMDQSRAVVLKPWSAGHMWPAKSSGVAREAIFIGKET